MALDIGEKRIGVAVSDAAARVATPLAVIDTSAALADGRELVRIVADYEVELAVIGLPLSLDGTEGPQARRTRSLAAKLARYLPVPVEFADERLSSVEAERRMAEAGASSRDRRGSVDMVAAAVILQSYLDARTHDDQMAGGD